VAPQRPPARRSARPARATTGVTEYIASQPRGVQAVLRQVRRLIRAAMPGAEEGISYGMPTYRLAGKAVVYFAGWKAHYSLYPVTAELVEALPEIGAYEVSRGTVRFLYSEPVPARLVGAIARRLAQRARAGAR